LQVIDKSYKIISRFVCGWWVHILVELCSSKNEKYLGNFITFHETLITLVTQTCPKLRVGSIEKYQRYIFTNHSSNRWWTSNYILE
jgi:hypothetical protein